MTSIGSLCSGIEGIGLGLETHGMEVAWFSEVDPAACRVLERHWPGVPNHGDITTAVWERVEPVDVVTAGYPCQPFSFAGERKGTDDERHLWPHVLNAVRVLRPRYLFAENVAGHLSLGFDVVLRDLAAIGFDVEWAVVRAADLGACHSRARLFFVATYPEGDGPQAERVSVGTGATRPGVGCRRQPAADADGGRQQVRVQRHGHTAPGAADGRSRRDHADRLVAAPADTAGEGRQPRRAAGRAVPEPGEVERPGRLHRRPEKGTVAWGQYGPAIGRWELVRGPAPHPLDDRGRLNPAFVEWMMGYPPGWVTGLGLGRTAELRLLGNAVVPHVAAVAWPLLTERLERAT